jgi:uncharacterized protein (TIGR02145 family)
MKTLLFLTMLLTFFNCLAQNEVKIGDQIWMNSNLSVTKFRNGDPIKEVKNEKEWEEAIKNKQPACCTYYFKSHNLDKYGRIYNWYAVSDPRLLAPKGWIIPTESDWKTMLDYLGPHNAHKLKSKTEWPVNEEMMFSYDGDNSSGFNAYPAGKMSLNHFSSIYASFWTSTEIDNSNAAAVNILYNTNDKINTSVSSKDFGYSVRCIKKNKKK